MFGARLYVLPFDVVFRMSPMVRKCQSFLTYEMKVKTISLI